MRKHRLPEGLFGITGEDFSRGRTVDEVVNAMIKGGIRVIQYREKDRGLRVKLEECRRIRALSQEHGVLFIVNDHVDLAMLVDADGVHVGQDDLPVAQVRALVGEEMMIGVSTHSLSQARRAMADGADYIGVGPIYATRTKNDGCDPVGLAYLDNVVREIPLPFVAIGGIKVHNIEQVVRHGAKTVALVTEILGAEDIRATVSELTAILKNQGNTQRHQANYFTAAAEGGGTK